MRKFSCLILIIILLAASFPNDYAQAANGTKASSVAVPITTGLVGSDNSAKSFYLICLAELPALQSYKIHLNILVIIRPLEVLL